MYILYCQKSSEKRRPLLPFLSFTTGDDWCSLSLYFTSTKITYALYMVYKHETAYFSLCVLRARKLNIAFCMCYMSSKTVKPTSFCYDIEFPRFCMLYYPLSFDGKNWLYTSFINLVLGTCCAHMPFIRGKSLGVEKFYL